MDKKPKEAKKPKEVKFAVDTTDEMIQNQVEGFKNCDDQDRVEGCNIAMDAYYGIQIRSRVVNGQIVEPEGIIEPSDVVVVETLQGE